MAEARFVIKIVASRPRGATRAANAKIGIYANIKPPETTMLLIASSAIGALLGSLEPSQAATTNNLANPLTALTAAPTKNPDCKPKPWLN